MFQLLFNTFFVLYRNKGNYRGVALRNEPHTNVDVVNCLFKDNVSKSIGVLFNRGVMLVMNCLFEGNSGVVRYICIYAGNLDNKWLQSVSFSFCCLSFVSFYLILFSNKKGGAIGASWFSTTILKNNVFRDNNDGAPLFFHSA